MIYSYAPVSTDGQSVDAQVHQVKAVGRVKVYCETASGAKTERAQPRRALIRARTGEGRARAKTRSVRLERKPKLTAHQKRETIAQREKGEDLTEIAHSYNMSHSTISRLKA
jgi:DNA invertase Pin-like site-specific DNA recombinase